MIKAIKNLSTGKFSFIPFRLIAGIAAGLLAGFLYYYFVGCRTGTCPITSNPYTSMIYGAIMGAIISKI